MKYYFILILVLFIFSCENSKQDLKMDEQYRPQIHFSPAANWMNDPNGMVYYEGEYHLFFQYYPDSTIWGPMHWGHAVSKDLLHWEELPIALFPDSLGWIFSGSAVIDYNNSSGFGTTDNPPMVAIFTYHNAELEKTGSNQYQYQGLAYSLDKGRSWTKYDQNPVLPNPGIRDFRDPKVSWSEKYQKWLMILAVVDHVNIYSSTDLKNWQFESEFGKELGAHGGVWECPDLVEMPVEKSKDKKWVMLVSINPGAPNGGSGTQYFVGDFDGKNFKVDNSATKWIDYGKDNYAGVTWNNSPENRTLFIGWMNNWQYGNEIPTGKWRGANTLARELILSNLKGDFYLKSLPIKELVNLNSKSEPLKAELINGFYELPNALKVPSKLSLQFESSIKSAEDFWVVFSNDKKEKIVFGYNKIKNEYYFDNTQNGWESKKGEFANVSTSPRISTNLLFDWEIIIDRSSIEVFADKGLNVHTHQYFSSSPFTKVQIFSKNGGIELKSGKLVNFKSIW